MKFSMRILPHLQNTGGFFVAAIKKKTLLPWEKKVEKKDTAEPSIQNEKVETTSTAGPQQKRRRLHGYKEDPYVFFSEDDLVWKQLKDFYKLSDEFNPLCLMTRSLSEKKKNVYFCSEQLRDLLVHNEDSVKMINTGVKAFVRCDNRHMSCPFR